jgi:hypothetical protein
VLCAVVATVHAEPASAYYDAITTAEDWAVVDSWLQQPGVPAELGSDATTITRWSRMRNAVGAGLGLDGMTAAAGINFPTFGVIAGGLLFGWEIGHASGLSGWASGKLLGIGNPTVSGATITAGTWANYTCTTGVNDFVPCGGRYSVGDRIWVLRATGSGCSTDYATTSWESAWSIDFACSSSANANLLTWLQGVAGSAGNAWVVTGDCTSSSSTDDCYAVFMGPKELLGNASFTQLRTYNSTTDSPYKTATIASVPRPSSIPYGSAAADAIEDYIEDDDILGPRVGTILHPSTDTGPGSELVPLPQPRLNETASQYRQRLRAAGFLGTITLLENAGPEVLPEFGPLVVTEIETSTATVELLDPWPSPPPTMAIPGTSSEIVVHHNPESAPAPGPDDPGGANDPPPGNAPPPGDGGAINVGDCHCPPPDFSPITELDYGDRFPFGVVSMVSGLFGTTLYASPDAPSFDFDFTSFHAGGFGPYDLGHYDVDLDVLDAYAAVMRTIIAWALWIGGLWWFGSRWLGFHGSGDPGEVVDEVWS